MFTLLKSAFRSPQQQPNDRALDTSFLASDPHDPDNEAVVTQAIYQSCSGQVRFRGRWWTARSAQARPIVPDEVVYVVGRRNVVLYVEAAGWAIAPAETGESTIATHEPPLMPTPSRGLLQKTLRCEHN